MNESIGTYLGKSLAEVYEAILDAATPRDDAESVYLGYDPGTDRFVIGFDAIRHLHEPVDVVGNYVISDSACYGLAVTCHVLDDGSVVIEDAERDWGTMFYHTHGTYSKLLAARPGIVTLRNEKVG